MMKRKTLSRESEDELGRLRALLAGADQARQPTGIRGFFHGLAERMASPQKKIIIKRLRDAEPVKPAKDDAA
jgi:hypothetical protein